MVAVDIGEAIVPLCSELSERTITSTEYVTRVAAWQISVTERRMRLAERVTRVAELRMRVAE